MSQPSSGKFALCELVRLWRVGHIDRLSIPKLIGEKHFWTAFVHPLQDFRLLPTDQPAKVYGSSICAQECHNAASRLRRLAAASARQAARDPHACSPRAGNPILVEEANCSTRFSHLQFLKNRP
jgi:hypothetical protein